MRGLTLAACWVAPTLLVGACAGGERANVAGPERPPGTTTPGSARAPATVISADGRLTVGVPAGSPVDEVTITSIDEPAPPDALAGARVVDAWELGPSGTTFDPPLELTAHYGPADLPAPLEPGTLPRIGFVVTDGSSYQTLDEQQLALDASTGELVLTATLPHLSSVEVIDMGGDTLVRLEMTRPAKGAVFHVWDEVGTAVEVTASGPDQVRVDSIDVESTDPGVLSVARRPVPVSGVVEAETSGSFGEGVFVCRKPAPAHIRAVTDGRLPWTGEGDRPPWAGGFTYTVGVDVGCRPLRLEFRTEFDPEAHATYYAVRVLRGDEDVTDDPDLAYDWTYTPAPDPCGDFGPRGSRADSDVDRMYFHGGCGHEQEQARVRIEVTDTTSEGVRCTYAYEQGARDHEGDTQLAPDVHACDEF